MVSPPARNLQECRKLRIRSPQCRHTYTLWHAEVKLSSQVIAWDTACMTASTCGDAFLDQRKGDEHRGAVLDGDQMSHAPFNTHGPLSYSSIHTWVTENAHKAQRALWI